MPAATAAQHVAVAKRADSAALLVGTERYHRPAAVAAAAERAGTLPC